MMFQEAKDKLAEMANGKFHQISYTLTQYHNGTLTPECSVYIDGHSHKRGDTWEIAIAKMDASVNPVPVTMEDAIAMAPTHNNTEEVAA